MPPRLRTTTTSGIATRDQAATAVEEYADLERQLADLETGMNRQMDVIRSATEVETAPLTTRMKQLHAALHQFAKTNRKNEFGDRQSLELPHGSLTFRRSSSIVNKSGVKAADVLKRLQEAGQDRYIKLSTPTVNREAMKSLPPKELDKYGVRLNEKETFEVKVKTEAVT